MKKKDIIHLPQRPRRNRKSAAVRALVCETELSIESLVMPLFVIPGKNQKTAVPSMPGILKFSPDLLVREAAALHALGIRALALFPGLPDRMKDKTASESVNPDGLLQKTVRLLKQKVPEMCVITDVAMDPYSSDGHDGLVRNGEILNDETLPILAAMAVSQAEAGADMVAPSDMMDGRIGYIRKALDVHGFEGVGIISYAVKYASSFYGPFRDALGSAPRAGDKKTYQMDPANVREAVREARFDVEEGADVVMVKPALPYLDVIRAVRESVAVPVAAYQVSGEYALIKAGAEKGWIDGELAMKESLLSIRRAGAGIIFTYFAREFAQTKSRRG